MKQTVVLLMAVVLAHGGSAAAGSHKLSHMAPSFVAAWNSGDVLAMQGRLAADATVADAFGRVARGRVSAAKLLIGASQLRITYGPIYSALGRNALVEFDAEIAGLRSADGTALPPEVRRFRMKLAWGPDLPGGHHPDGRFFISSLTVDPAPRSAASILFTVIRRSFR